LAAQIHSNNKRNMKRRIHYRRNATELLGCQNFYIPQEEKINSMELRVSWYFKYAQLAAIKHNVQRRM